MSISKTTFRITQRKLTGPEGLKNLLLALRDVLPYCQIDCVQLNRQKFSINTTRYPDSIWHELLRKREWHDKLIYHLANSLVVAKQADRMAIQLDFARLITAEDTQFKIHGTMLYESEGTPIMLQTTGLPAALAYGCELEVDAYTEFLKRSQRDVTFQERHAVQRDLYETMLKSQPLPEQSVVSS